MKDNQATRRIRDLFAGRIWQSLAVLFCVLFGIAVIANTQMEGEAWWFWYARLFRGGARLYADLHLPLQPFKVLEMDAWLRMFGTTSLANAAQSVLFVLVFSLGMFLILQQSKWPDWQKAIVLASAFLITIDSGAYRFDDYHIVMDTFSCYSVALLLLSARSGSARQQLGLAAGLGLISGLAVTTRSNDGGALLVATGVCLLFLLRHRKVAAAGLFLGTAALTAIIVIKLTGDSFPDYATNSIFKAAHVKGGARSIFAAPAWLFLAAIYNIGIRRWLLLWLGAVAAANALLLRRWKGLSGYLVLLQLGMAGAVYVLSSGYHRQLLRSESFFLFAAYSAILANYVLVPVVAARFKKSELDATYGWDPREVLILIPLAELASFATSNSGTIATFFSPVALLLLLAAVLQPFRRRARWVNTSLVTMMVLMGLSTMAKKIEHPYDWLYERASPMFEDRQWYRHPIYGPMYLEKDQLDLFLSICREIGAGNPKPELLSMPFAYANYFCDIPPWHGYVQTFYDTVTPSTVETLMDELRTAPPEWIVYQRQMRFETQAELTYHGGQALPHRALDKLILEKIATGQWKLVEKSRALYVEPDALFVPPDPDDGWYVIRTRP